MGQKIYSISSGVLHLLLHFLPEERGQPVTRSSADNKCHLHQGSVVTATPPVSFTALEDKNICILRRLEELRLLTDKTETRFCIRRKKKYVC